MDLRDIQNLIKFVAKSGASEVKLEMEDVKITIKTNPDESGREQVYVQQLPIAQQLQRLLKTNLHLVKIANISLSNHR